MIEINEERLVSTFIELLAIDSPSGREKPLADLLAERLTSLGFAVNRHPCPEGHGGDTGNLVAVRRGRAPVAPVFFSAHMDTVQPTPNIQIVREGGVIRTDGSTILGADDKAGIAAAMEGILAADESSIFHGDVELVLTVSEEIGLVGAKALKREHLRSRLGYVLDSSKPVGGLVDRAPYQDKMHVTVHGKAAHAGIHPEQGINAIEIAASAIAGLNTGRIDEETTSNVGVIRGGKMTNIVPDSCRVDLEARSQSEAKLEAEVARLRAAFQDVCSSRGVPMDWVGERCYNGYAHSRDAFIVGVAREAAEAAGIEFSTHPSGGGTDANILNALDIEAAVLGVGMSAVHTNEEHIAIADLAACARWVAAIIECLASKQYVVAED